MLDDELDLRILEKLVSGTGVSVNVSALAKSLGKRRNTVKAQVQELFDNEIISGPCYPFTELLNQRPLFAVVRADLPRSEQVERFLVEDETILASFRSWDEGYNTLILEFHSDPTTYYHWKERIVEEKKLPPLEGRFPADVVFLNNNLHIKYDPNSSLYCLEKRFKEKGELEINGYRIRELGFQILRKLLRGEGIKTNEHLLARELSTHRRTVEKRLHRLLDAGLVSRPVCQFPKYFVPPDYVLVFCFARVNRSKERIYRYISNQCSIPIAYRGHTGRYNLAFFATFANVEEHFLWEENLHRLFPDDCFGAMKKIYLSPRVTITIDHQKVSLGVIHHKMMELKAPAPKT